MKKASLLTLLFCSLYLSVWSQEISTISLKGKITDEAKLPIAFTSISLNKDSSIGTYSSATGRFEIRVPLQLIKDSLSFSCLGYETLSIPVQSISDSILIVLKSKAYTLNEVTFTYDSSIRILEQATQGLKKTLPADKSILQGFYREIIRSDDTYDRLIEAAVDVFDKGYNPTDGNKNLLFKIRELRKSEDYMDLDWKASILNYLFPKNGLNGADADALFLNDYIRNNTTSFFGMINASLNDSFFEYSKISIDSTIFYNGENHYCISVSPKNDSDTFLPYGRIYVRVKDFAIVEMDIAMKVKSSERASVGASLTVPGEDFIFKTIIKYKEYNNKMYLSFLYRKSFRQQMNYTVFNKSEGKKGVFYDEKLFITNEIITERNKLGSFRKKERQKNNVDLYSNEWVYNEAFWKSYNVVNENPLSPNIKSDLERDDSLSNQFKKQ